MQNPDPQAGNMEYGSIEDLRQTCLHVVRFMSTIAMDPHLYFEAKLTAEFAAVDCPDELLQRLRQLVEWVDASGLSESQTRRLDAALTADGLPSFSQMRAWEGCADDAEQPEAEE